MAAFEELVEKYRQPIITFFIEPCRMRPRRKISPNMSFFAFKSAHRYRVSAKFSTWLYTIARNLCLNEIRRRSRHPADSLDAVHPESDDLPVRQYEDTKNSPPPELVLQSELVQKIEEALAGLPENQRTAILLFREDELSYEEIAKILGSSLSATKSLIHRGRETLKQKLKPYLRSGVWRETKQL